LILSAVVCGAIYMVVTPPPAPERVQTEPRSRTLAYQEKIARAAEEVQEEQAAAPQAAPAETSPAHDTQAATTPEPGAQPPAAGQDATEMAGLPPDQEAPSDPNALPWQHPRATNPQDARGVNGEMGDPMAPQPESYGDSYDPRAPRQGQYGDHYDPRVPPREAYGDPYDPRAPRPGPYGDPYDPNASQRDAYGDPYDPNAPRRYGGPEGSRAGYPRGQEADPNAWPGRPGERPEEWVQVLVSGVGMRGTASEESPMLFAFPSGRVLRVVSRYGDWVEVTDPNSATTGWMRARYLVPVAAPGPRHAAGPIYEDEPRRGRRWWKRLWRSF
jgi:hypothetical protein